MAKRKVKHYGHHAKAGTPMQKLGLLSSRLTPIASASFPTVRGISKDATYVRGIPSGSTTRHRRLRRRVNAYLDIETSYEDSITVIGIYFENGKVVQLVGEEVTHENVFKELKHAARIYTYNGNSFDLPKILKRLGLDIKSKFRCHDLMYDCWRCSLYGGLKSVERQLGIYRKLSMDGKDAMVLWREYEYTGNKDTLKTLLEYNLEDIKNLTVLRKKLLKK